MEWEQARYAAVVEDGRCAGAPRNKAAGLLDGQKRCGWALLNQGKHAAMVPNWLAFRDGSGIKASVAASCGLRGCLAPQSTRAMLGI
jgi:hypothetical protein